MARRADIGVIAANVGQFNAGSTYVVQANNGSLYMVLIDDFQDVVWTKSSDGGLSWTSPVVILAGTATQLSVWYDRWSSVSGDLIHCAYTDSTDSDTKYRTINTASSDALSTQTVIFAGVSSAAGGHISITRAKGGNVYCKSVIDAGAEGGFFRLPNANVPNGAWDAARTVDETIATLDKMILLPDLVAADNQDILALFWDASASEISRKIYDDSANSWAETSIATSMTDVTGANYGPFFSAAMDITNSRILMVAWSNVDTLNADLRCWVVTAAAITETTTNVVLNSTDDQGICAIGLDTNTNYWWVAYGGKSDGSETFATAINVYYKVSQDAGATWGAETRLSTITAGINGIWTVPRFTGPLVVAYYRAHTNEDMLMMNVSVQQPRATYVAGIF